MHMEGKELVGQELLHPIFIQCQKLLPSLRFPVASLDGVLPNMTIGLTWTAHHVTHLISRTARKVCLSLTYLFQMKN